MCYVLLSLVKVARGSNHLEICGILLASVIELGSFLYSSLPSLYNLRFIPVPLVGFGQLLQRVKQQDEETKQHLKRLQVCWGRKHH